MLRPTPFLLAADIAAAASPVADLQDFESLRERPIAEEAAELAASPLKLSAAVALAEKELSGRASEARVLPGEGIAEVVVLAGSEAWRVRVDAGGELVDKRKEPPYVLPGAPVYGDWVETPSGLRYYELVVGEGKQPPGPSTVVKVHYTGWLVDGKKFDSSVDRGRPSDFALNGVIKGWTEGVGGMRVGGKRKLILPYDLAYGASGSRGIPPKATLIFDIELISFVE